MNKQTKYNIGSYDHKQLEELVFRNPKLVHEHFIPLRKELIILRGKLDILGSVLDQNCIVEIKVDKVGGLKAIARKQLKKYARAINDTLSWFDIEPLNFSFCIIRNSKNNLYIDYYENMEELCKEKYSNGIGYYKGNKNKAKEKHLTEAYEKYKKVKGIR